MANYWDKPCAANGLASYRCRGRFGWIMIGAISDEGALIEARRSWEGATIDTLERWSGERYKSVVEPRAQ